LIVPLCSVIGPLTTTWSYKSAEARSRRAWSRY
jgi:hypothetical protein